jgi:3',5'-cyclic-nucleotide phosphodiesterase
MQATFCFLQKIGAIPSYKPELRSDGELDRPSHSPIADLIEPVDAFVLLIAALGHDVGHPGVNNAFMTAIGSPLALLYNDRSVLENYHCAAYTQLLRRHWKSVYEDKKLRVLLIEVILATDMLVHNEYMAKMGNLQGKLAHYGGTDGFDPKELDAAKQLTGSLLIKCADISNVVSP